MAETITLPGSLFSERRNATYCSTGTSLPSPSERGAHSERGREKGARGTGCPPHVAAGG
jgi:hypothetical protein